MSDITLHKPKADWTARNPVLPNGVYGFEDETGKVKVGDGAKRWIALPYLDVPPYTLPDIPAGYFAVPPNGSVTTAMLAPDLATKVDSGGLGGGSVYVSLDGSDTNDGKSWTKAKRTVKAGVLALPSVTVGSETFYAGTVVIGPGEFVEAGNIPVNREVRLVGSNAKSDNVGTRITLAAGANKHVFAYTSDWATADGYAHGVVYENLTISANVSAQGSAAVATGGITAAATTLALAAVGSLPTTGTFDVLIDGEILGVTAGAGSTSLTVTRGKYGTVAATHSAAAVVRYAGSAIVMRGGGFNTQLVNVHCRDAGGPAVRVDHSAVDLHCFNFNASACGGPAFAYIPSATSSGSMISFLGGQIDDCGSDAMYFEGQSGAGVVNISAMKFEARVSTTKHKHCVASRPHSSNGSGMVFNVEGVVAYALGGNREAVIYNYNGTSQGAAWNLTGVIGRDGYLLAFKSDRYPVQSPSHTVGVLHAGNFDTGAELAQIQIGSSQVINSPWNANPNGVVTAPRGWLYLYTGGSTGPVLWIKETGTDNQGWVASPGLVTTDAEAVTGTNTTRAMTPANVKAAIAAQAQQIVSYYVWKEQGGNVKAMPRLGSGLPTIADGTASAVIQACINALTVSNGSRGASGGRIHIARGFNNEVYFLGNELTITGWEGIANTDGVPESQLQITGDGATQLVQQTAGQNAIVIKNLASVVISDMRIYCSPNSKSCILGDRNGVNSEMSLWRSTLNNLYLSSNSTTSPALYLKNFFDVNVPIMIVQSSANHGTVLENDSTTTNYGNSHFGFFSSGGSTTQPYAGLVLRSTNGSKAMNLLSFDTYENVGGGYYGLYCKGARFSTFNFVDIEGIARPVYFDGEAGNNETRHIKIKAGYLLTAFGGTAITATEMTGGNDVSAHLQCNDADTPILDQSLYRPINRFDIELGNTVAEARISIARPQDTELTVRRIDGSILNRLPAGSTVATPTAGDDTTKVATTAFVKTAMRKVVSASSYSMFPNNGSGFGANVSAGYQQSRLLQRTPKAGRNLSLEYVTTNGPGEAGLGGDGSNVTIRAAVEYPAGTFYPAYSQDGNRDIVVTPNGGIGRLFVPGFEVPANADWWVRTRYYAGAGGVIPYVYRTNMPSEWAIGPNTTSTDLTVTDTGAPAPGSGNPGYSGGPSAVLYEPYDPQTKSLVILGDSISAGHGEDSNGVTYFTSNPGGWAVRALSPAWTGKTAVDIAPLSLGIGGEKAVNVLGTKGRSRFQLIDDTDIRNAWVLFTNDIQDGAATMQSNLLKLWTMLANRGIRTVAFTIPPRTSSTDNWATLANQSGTEPARATVNPWMRAGAPINATTKAAVAVGTANALVAGNVGHPLAQVVDICPAVETATDSNRWKSNGSAFGYTIDGVHPSPLGYLEMAKIARTQAVSTLVN